MDTAKQRIEAILEDTGVVLLDGGLATTLEEMGNDLNHSLWSAKLLMTREGQDAIREAHRSFFKAGANIAITSSYQASRPGLAEAARMGEEEADTMMQQTVLLAQQARDLASQEDGAVQPMLIAASLGPYGAYLADGSEYRGNYGRTEEELMDFHRPRIAALLDAGPDLLAFETFPCASEARAVVRLLQEEFPQVVGWMSFSCKDGAHSCSGEDWQTCVEAASCPQIMAVGVNCTAPQHVRSLLEAARAVSPKHLVAYPNSGEVYDPEAKVWQADPVCLDAVSAARSWRDTAGISRVFIGGCCRTAPRDISLLCQDMKVWKAR